MRHLLAIPFLALLPTFAHAKPAIRDVQASHGLLGPERKSSEYVAGDEVFYRFTITGSQTDKEGRLRGEFRVMLTGPKGKVLAKSESLLQQLPVLGAESIPAQVIWSIGEDFLPGEYEGSVEFVDLVANESASFKRKFTVKPVEFALLRARFYHDNEERVPARAGGTVGQNLVIKFKAIGFDRSQGEIDVQMEMQVLDAQGKPLAHKPIRATVHNEKPEEIKAIDRVNFSGLLTLNRAGDFILRVTVTDTVGKKKAQFEAPFRVVAP